MIVQIINYFKGATTNERYGRGNNRDDSFEESIDLEEVEMMRLKTSSTDDEFEVKRPHSRRKIARAKTEQGFFDPVLAIKKMNTKRELKNQYKFRCSNFLTMCRHTRVKSQRDILRKQKA